MCRHCGAVPCRHIDVVQPPKLPGQARLQEAMPVCLRESLLDTPDSIHLLGSTRQRTKSGKKEFCFMSGTTTEVLLLNFGAAVFCED